MAEGLVHHQCPDQSSSPRLLTRLESSPRKLIAAYWDDLDHERERTQFALAAADKGRSQSDYQRGGLEHTGANMTTA
jgi:hypothetical protein